MQTAKKDVQAAVDAKDRSNCKEMQNMNDRKVRKLQANEHILTRKLWEEVFVEDTPEFLDYYYSVKTKDNEIYVIEDGNEIVSMIHLNPYDMRIGDMVYQTHYIVAVATKESYRKCGLMRQLLNHVLRVMTERGEPFTFLMPASEEIYRPFGLEYVYEQRQGKVTGKSSDDPTFEIISATEDDCQNVADFANQILHQYDIVTWRTASYYETLFAELASEDGGILVAKRKGKIVGVFCYAQGSEIIIREPLCLDKAVLQHAIYHLTGSETERVLCIGYGSEETKPMIMAKVLNPEFNFVLKNAKIFINEEV